MEDKDNEINNKIKPLKKINKNLKTRVKSLEYLVRGIYCRKCKKNVKCGDCSYDICPKCFVRHDEYRTTYDLCILCDMKRMRKYEEEQKENEKMRKQEKFEGMMKN